MVSAVPAGRPGICPLNSDMQTSDVNNYHLPFAHTVSTGKRQL